LPISSESTVIPLDERHDHLVHFCFIASHFKDGKEYKLYVQLDSVREMYQTAIGAHPDQSLFIFHTSRHIIPDLKASSPTRRVVRKYTGYSAVGRGLTEPRVDTYDGFSRYGMFFSCSHRRLMAHRPADFVVFAYLAQCRCDPMMTPTYFTNLTNIVKHLQHYGTCPTQLQELLVMEQSRGRFTLEDVSTSATTLGFGVDNVLAVEYDEEIPDEFVENAWRDCVKRSWRDQTHGAETQRLANESLRILAESRNSTKLRNSWEVGKNKFMNPDRAYDTLEIPKEVEDHMLITVYNMRVS